MKLLILTVTAGEGHNSIGNSVRDYILENYQNDEVMMVEMIREDHPFLSFMLNDVQYSLLRYFGGLERINYEIGISRKPDKFNNMSLWASMACKDRMIELINVYKPDAIFSTHTYSSALINYLINTGEVSCKTFTIIPDWVMHLDPENNIDFDWVFTPYTDMHADLVAKGLHEERMLPYGLPCNPKFFKKYDREKVKARLHITNDNFNVMVLMGGMGVGNSFTIVKELSKVKHPINIIVINGKNEQQKKKIDKYVKENGITNVYNRGFTKHVAEYMSISDLMIGKVGGMSTNEAFAANLPLVCPFKPPFQEYWSMQFLEKKGTLKSLPSIKDTPKYIDHVIDHPQELQSMKDNINKVFNKDSTKHIVDFMLRGIRYYGND